VRFLIYENYGQVLSSLTISVMQTTSCFVCIIFYGLDIDSFAIKLE